MECLTVLNVLVNAKYFRSQTNLVDGQFFVEASRCLRTRLTVQGSGSTMLYKSHENKYTFFSLILLGIFVRVVLAVLKAE